MKHRPRRFRDVVGQVSVVAILKQQVRRAKVGHAYLLAGQSGTGKTSIARILAAAVNCGNQRAGEPCGRCGSCKLVAAGSHWDVLEMNGASERGIEDVRALISKSFLSPISPRKVYIIDEAHGLTAPAWEALLTSLEEPPPHLLWVLCTTQPENIPGTVLSRCLSFRFTALSNNDILSYLERVARRERLQADVGGLRFIATTSAGNLRFALTLLEQVVSVNGRLVSTRQVKQVVEAVRLF